ncbi:Uncharacterized protein HA466_0046100 [Hirschfeldia incana]|nr:Uncharacterized protein HA466_0046100 [Hirschfeldia incana]
MEGEKRTPLSVRKKPKRTNTRLVRSVVDYLQSDAYLFAPLFSKFSPKMQMPSPSSFISSKTSDVKVKKNEKILSEKVKDYLKSDCYMYRPMSSRPKRGSSLKEGELRITNLVTMELSTSSDLRSSDIAEHTFHSGRISSPKRPLVILDGQRSRETDLSPAFSSLPEEKMVKPDPRRVTIE